MAKDNLIFLCGFMGSGKTTHGRKLARILRRRFIDLDQYIESSCGQKISGLFSNHGETYFRAIESQALKEVISGNLLTVIALGGGTPCFNENLRLLKQSGILVYLRLDEKTLCRRLAKSPKERPLVQGKTDEELADYIRQLMAVREPYYMQADIVLNGISLKPEQIAEAILDYKADTTTRPV